MKAYFWALKHKSLGYVSDFDDLTQNYHYTQDLTETWMFKTRNEARSEKARILVCCRRDVQTIKVFLTEDDPADLDRC